jgi:hypothetical protein
VASIAGLARRLERLEATSREHAVARLRAALGAATDEQIALVVAAHRRGDRDEADRRLGALGFTSALTEHALGPDWRVLPPAAVNRRLGEIFRGVTSEPRRSRIRAKLVQLRGEDPGVHTGYRTPGGVA